MITTEEISAGATLPAIAVTRPLQCREWKLPELGELRAHSLGVRGLITCSPGVVTKDDVEDHLREIRRQGVKRVHVVLSQDELQRDDNPFVAAGFHPCPGETLFLRRLTAPPVVNDIPLGYCIRPGLQADVVEVARKCVSVPELAFESWELPLLHTISGNKNTFFTVAEHNGEIVGISIGGAAQNAGTITHLWVDRDHRQHHVGHALSEASLSTLWEAGARRIHLMTTAGNRGANAFWIKQGFAVAGENFLEIDL